MSVRLVSESGIRRSVRIGTLAADLDCDESQIRELLEKGEIEGHGLGTRGVRVYVDSVIAYQERKPKGGAKPGKPIPATDPKSRRTAAGAAHSAAMDALREAGVLT